MVCRLRSRVLLVRLRGRATERQQKNSCNRYRQSVPKAPLHLRHLPPIDMRAVSRDTIVEFATFGGLRTHINIDVMSITQAAPRIDQSPELRASLPAIEHISESPRDRPLNQGISLSVYWQSYNRTRI